MPQCNTIRSFTILLLVKLVVESHVDAFTIQRVVESTFHPGLINSESNYNEKEESFKVIDISNQQNNITSPETNNTKQIVRNIEEEHNKATEKIERSKNITETPEIKATEKILNVTTNDITVTTSPLNHTLEFASSSTIEAEEETEGDDKVSSTVTESGTTSTESTTSIYSTLEDDFTSTIGSTLEENSISTRESPNSSEPSVTITDFEANGTKSRENYTQVNNATNYSSSSILNDNSSSIFYEENNMQQKYETIKARVGNDSYSTRTVVNKPTTESNISSKESDDYTHQESSTASAPRSVSDQVHKALEHKTVQEITTEENSVERDNTPFIKGYSTESLIPYWKKYTEIDRKRLNSKEQADFTTNGSETLVHAESGKSAPTIFPSLEKVFGTSNISSLDKRTNELFALTRETGTPPGTDPVITVSPAETTQVADVTAASQTSTVLRRIDVVSSLRAGYLDYSSRSTEEPQTTAIKEKYSSTITEASVLNLGEEMTTEVSLTEYLSKEPSFAAITTTDSTTSLLELGASISNQEPTSESVNQMNITQGVIGFASQSQLAEDAINEELMKEEILTDNVEYYKRYRDERLHGKALNNKETFSTNMPQIIQPEDTSIDDKLSVKPISYEKKNISTIYTVNPNYKPLKKIDVQPPKSFLRNPDDNSWRNESLSTLGIVFKGKNSTKAFTEVLKNKTEMQLNSLSEIKPEEQSPELRTRLEKIAEQRKSKKKKTDYFGNTYYTDYEENTSHERTTTQKTSVFDDIMSRFTELTTISPENPITESLEINKINLKEFRPVDTFKNKTKQKKIIDEYESEEDEVDYAHDIDLKKFKTKNNYVTPKAPYYETISKATTQPTVDLQTTVSQFLPERKPTVQYFPPRERPKVVVNEYDDSFRSKVNEYTFSKTQAPMMANDIPPITAPPTYVPWNRTPQHTLKSIWQNKQDVDKNIYVTHPTTTFDQNSYIEKIRTDGYHRPTYLIKHLKDFINNVAKDDDSYVTEIPYIGVTAANEARKRVKVKPPPDYYDYEAQFRKDVLDRFVENFNQHSERFKVDFPILYNTSVVHSQLADESKGAIASSNAFMKRLYEDTHTLRGDSARKKFDPNCDKTIELSPAYELHYYVPEEEEKEVQERRLTNAPSHLNVPSPHFVNL